MGVEWFACTCDIEGRYTLLEPQVFAGVLNVKLLNYLYFYPILSYPISSAPST
jgi:hypothetical protein